MKTDNMLYYSYLVHARWFLGDSMFIQETATKYVNLYTETEYSLLSSPNRLQSLIEKAKSMDIQR